MNPEYDVFVSFKNLGPDGTQTQDSSLAREIHDYLSAQGLRVFFSTVSLEHLGVAGYKRAIDEALDSAHTLVAVGTSIDNLTSEWVRYEWDSFYNDILSRRKPRGRVFSYISSNVDINFLPRTLRENQTIVHQPGALSVLSNFIVNALAVQSVSRLTEDSQTVIARLHQLTELMAESRVLELEITLSRFQHTFSAEERERMQAHINKLRELTGGK